MHPLEGIGGVGWPQLCSVLPGLVLGVHARGCTPDAGLEGLGDSWRDVNA